MAIEIKHPFQSAKADGPDPTKVQPSNWNEAHDFEMGSGKLAGRYSGGAGPAEEIGLGTGLAFDAGNLELDAGYVAAAAGLIGEIKAYAGLTEPEFYLWCNGQAVNRTTYADLFDALTTLQTVDMTSGNTTLAAVGNSVTELGLVGASVEGVGIPSGATIVSATGTTIVLSAAPTISDTDINVRILPWGRGDGTNTFNVPDMRGRVGAGRDNLGGSAASRLTSGTDRPTGSRLASSGGVETHALVTAELAAHSHSGTTGTDGNHDHGGATAGGGAHNHSYSFRNTTRTVQSGAGEGTIWQGNSSANTDNAPSHTHSIATDGNHNHTFTTSTVGSGTAHNNVQPTLMINYIIFAGA